MPACRISFNVSASISVCVNLSSGQSCIRAICARSTGTSKFDHSTNVACLLGVESKTSRPPEARRNHLTTTPDDLREVTMARDHGLSPSENARTESPTPGCLVPFLSAAT